MAAGRVARRCLLLKASLMLIFAFSCSYGGEVSARDGRLFVGKKLSHRIEKLEKGTFDVLKKVVLGTVFVSVLACSGLYCGSKALDVIRKHRTLKADVMLDTIIRFEDDVLNRDFHYVLKGRDYTGHVVDWQHPYTEITVRSSHDGVTRPIPVKTLQGKSIEWHIHERAEITFPSREDGIRRLHGHVYRVFDNGIYQTVVHSEEDSLGNVTELEFQRFEFVAKEDIATLRPAEY